MYKFPEFNSLVDLHLRTGQSGHALPTPDTAPVTSLSAAGPPQRPDKTPFSAWTCTWLSKNIGLCSPVNYSLLFSLLMMRQ